MIPTVGRIIHLRQDPSVPCRAAIVNGLDYGAGKDTVVYLGVFHPHWNSAPVAIVSLTLPSDRWHDPTACIHEDSNGLREMPVGLSPELIGIIDGDDEP